MWKAKSYIKDKIDIIEKDYRGILPGKLYAFPYNQKLRTRVTHVSGDRSVYINLGLNCIICNGIPCLFSKICLASGPDPKKDNQFQHDWGWK
jgi:hypothetical protein